MGRSSEDQCRICQAPAQVRDLIQKLRMADVSLRDAAACVKVVKDFDIAHGSIARHESHWDRETISAPTDVPLEEVTVTHVAKKKLQLYWQARKDEIPSDSEARAWMKLLAELAQTEIEGNKVAMFRSMFAQKALPETVEVVGQ